MPNIKFSYLYRDDANYKNYGFVVFKNDQSLDIEQLQKLIQCKLIDGTWFYADKWNLPDLFPDTFDHRIDPTWHEFESIQYTNEAANTTNNLVEQILKIKVSPSA